MDLQDVKNLVTATAPLHDIKVQSSAISAHVTPHKRIYIVQKHGENRMNLHIGAERQLYQKIGYPQSERFTSKIAWETMDRIIDELYSATYKNDKELLIRADKENDTVVAFLSNRYNPYDNRDLLTNVEIGLCDVAWNQEIHDPYVNDYKCLFKVIFPEHSVTDSETELNLTPGLFISNDETGNGAVYCSQVISLTYGEKPLYFSNVKHISAQRTCHTSKYVDAANAVVKSCETLPKFAREFIATIHDAQSRKLNFTELSELYEYIGKTLVRKDEVRNILSLWDNQNRSLWTLGLAISRAAYDYNPLRRAELEKLATQILVRKY
jgi:hypothetical protein